MKKKRNRLPRRILNILIVIAAVCVVGYFAFCYWVNASGSLVGHNLPNPEDMDQGSAIVVNGAGRRDGVFTLFIGATDENEIRTNSMMVNAIFGGTP